MMIQIHFRAGNDTVYVVPKKFAIAPRQCVPWHIVSEDPDVIGVRIEFSEPYNFFPGCKPYAHHCERDLPRGTPGESIIYGYAPPGPLKCEYTVRAITSSGRTIKVDPMIIVTEDD